MAFAILSRGIPMDVHSPGWLIDNVSWWRWKTLAEEFSHRRIVDATGYLDYVCLLTPAEAMEWQSRFAQAYELAYPDDGLWLNERIAELSSHLDATRESTRWVLVQQYEWESGLSS